MGSGRSQCQSQKPISGNCDCHFIGACDWTTSPPAPNTRAAAAQPKGLKAFAKRPRKPHTITVCEGTQNTMAIFYDCDLRIPLYSARVLTDADMQAAYSAVSQRTGFRQSAHITPALYLQRNGDYGTNGRDQIPCYERARSKPAGSMYYETRWYSRALRYKGRGQFCKSKLLLAKKITSKIQKGHLIASNYGKAAVNGAQSVSDTFTLSNIVPQFGDMNGNAWMRNEQSLLNWASGKCASTATNRRDGRLFIVVGKYLERRFLQVDGQ